MTPDPAAHQPPAPYTYTETAWCIHAGMLDPKSPWDTANWVQIATSKSPPPAIGDTMCGLGLGELQVIGVRHQLATVLEGRPSVRVVVFVEPSDPTKPLGARMTQWADLARARCDSVNELTNGSWTCELNHHGTLCPLTGKRPGCRFGEKPRPGAAEK